MCAWFTELRRLATPETRLILGIIVVEDVFLALYLAALQPILGDASLESQIDPSDRRQVGEALGAILGGASGAYELLVRRITGPRSSEAMRVLARRSPRGGMEGVVLPPSLPFAVLPEHVADRLTPREREIVRLLAAGYRVKQLSEQLYLSNNTVRNHLKNIFGKLGVSSQAELIALVNDPHTSHRVASA